MKLVVISDTHSYHREVNVPDGDVLICCGDITNKGELSIIEDFSNWLKELQHKNKVVIFGNHELGMANGPKRKKAIELIESSGAFYLENSEVVIDGLKFYGSPATPRFYDWEWNYNRGEDIAKEWSKIPEDVNILITHGPPYGTLDMVEDTIFNRGRDLHQGCKDLKNRQSNLKELKCHLFGHLHSDGSKIVKFNNVIYGNAAICTEQYQPTNKPLVIEL
jgi:Icc-related predicted phosphoesterase